MKKNIFGFISGLGILTLVFVSGFVSCTVGLGAAVDVKTPELTISYPETKRRSDVWKKY